MTDYTPPTDTDFDGCNRKCRAQQRHTMEYGRCEHADKPEPTVSMSKICTGPDGYPSIGYDQYTVPQLAELIEPALTKTAPGAWREIPEMAAEAARAIVHRNDGPVVPAALPSIHANDVEGFCPACGHGVLMLGDGGHVVCTLMDCPRPEAADELLRNVAVPSAPAGRGVLRDCIAEALYAHSHPGWATRYTDIDRDERDTYLARADAVLAVLPPPVDRAAVLAEAADAPAAECSAQNRNYESGPRLCIRAAQHHGDHIDERGFHWSDTVAVYPMDDGTFRQGTDVRAVLRRMAGEAQQPETQATGEDIASADNPTLLRWGLDDVLWGDDGSVTVLLSGPECEPYWLELDPERAAVLRRNLGGPDAEAEARPSVEIECANCWRLIENRGAPSMGGPSHDNWVHVPGGFTVCFPQRGADSPRAEPKPAAVARPGKEA